MNIKELRGKGELILYMDRFTKEESDNDVCDFIYFV